MSAIAINGSHTILSQSFAIEVDGSLSVSASVWYLEMRFSCHCLFLQQPGDYECQRMC